MNEFLLNQGLSGVAMLAMGYAIIHLYQAKEKAQEKHREEIRRLGNQHREEVQRLVSQIREMEDKHNQRFLSVITTSATQGEQMLTAIAGINESLSLQKVFGDKLDSTFRKIMADAQKIKETS